MCSDQRTHVLASVSGDLRSPAGHRFASRHLPHLCRLFASTLPTLPPSTSLPMWLQRCSTDCPLSSLFLRPFRHSSHAICTSRHCQDYDRIDLLVNNAGVFNMAATMRAETNDGYESHVQVRIAHFRKLSITRPLRHSNTPGFPHADKLFRPHLVDTSSHAATSSKQRCSRCQRCV